MITEALLILELVQFGRFLCRLLFVVLGLLVV
jgi:hypothetical protein